MDKNSKILLLFILLSCTVNLFSSEVKLKNFKTDNCTFFPEGTFKSPDLWVDCCLYHDLKYWIGGTLKEQHQADIKLKECVTEKAGHFYGTLMYRGVLLGHYSPVKSQYRWGWGWNSGGFFGELNLDQLNLAKKIVLESNVKPEIIDLFISEYLSKDMVSSQ